MITQEHQLQLKNAALYQNKETIERVFHKVIKEEICSINNISDVAVSYMDILVNQIAAPSKVDVRVVETNDKQKKEKVSLFKVQEIMTGLSFLVVALTTSELGLLWGIILSCIFIACLFWKKQKKDAYMQQQNKTDFIIEERVDVEELIERAEKIATSFRHVAGCLLSPVGTTLQKPLHENYSNVVRWIQRLYSDCEEFDEKTQNYIRKRLKAIASQCYYDIACFDGDNSSLFEKERQQGRTTIYMAFPAIIYRKTGKVVVPGILLVPSDFKA